MTEQQLNSPENLILLCPTHHSIVDGHPDDHPADLLRAWKRQREWSMRTRLSGEIGRVSADILAHPYFPTELIDERIRSDLDTIIRSRFFTEFDTGPIVLDLCERVLDRELSGGSDVVRGRALAWCARLLVGAGESDRARQCLDTAGTLGPSVDLHIASGFVSSVFDGKASALRILASLDNHQARSAALMVVKNLEGPEGAVEWLEATSLAAPDLDAEGRLVLLTVYVELGFWEQASDTVGSLTEEDFLQVKALHHVAAIVCVASTVPDELRAVIVNQLPFDAVRFPLAADAASILARRNARDHFLAAAEAALTCGCAAAAKHDAAYALWLDLRDDLANEEAKRRLEGELRAGGDQLRLVPLALQFNVPVDLGAIEREISRETALHGGLTEGAAVARLSLAFVQASPAEVAGYLDRHLDELLQVLDREFLLMLQIEMLARSRHPEQARQVLERLRQDGLSVVAEGRLGRMIDEAEGADPVEGRRLQYQRTDSLADLNSLLSELESRSEWSSACEYATVLFERTRAISDAERLANALWNSGRSSDLLEFLNARGDLVTRSEGLHLLFCWSLYSQGSLIEARSELERASSDYQDVRFRELDLRIRIGLGDWGSLASVVLREHQHRDERSPEELIRAAHLALHLGLPQSKELVVSAAEKGRDDAGVLAAAYSLASRAGWEEDPRVFRWLDRAAGISGEDGPVRAISLEEVFEQHAPEWDRRESKTWEALGAGRVPIYLAARSLNRSVVDMVSFRALANLSESDPRRRGAIPAFSGRREKTQPDVPARVAIEATSVLTLSLVGQLDKVIAAIERVVIPHSLLPWLFAESDRAEFHQPSRIRDARRLRDLIATGVIHKAASAASAESDLVNEVGDELASLILRAEAPADNVNQHVVVRSGPVHRVGSLMRAEADLSQHGSVLRSCQSVVSRLRSLGQLTIEEAARCIAFLQLHEQPWPEPAEVSDDAVLYLDRLSVSYFLHLEVLEKLHTAGWKVFVSQEAVDDADDLIAYGQIAGGVRDSIERIRQALCSGIESGKVHIGPVSANPNSASTKDHPTSDVIELAPVCDAIVSDDRFLNQHGRATGGGHEVPTFTTLELLEGLVEVGGVTSEDVESARTLLRRAGYAFVPVDYSELCRHIEACGLEGGALRETVELRAIREQLLKARMIDWLQLPSEGAWLDAVLNTLLRAVQEQWVGAVDFELAKARSEWILDHCDVRGWVHRLASADGVRIVKRGRAAQILKLLALPAGCEGEARSKYWSWVEARLLEPTKQQFPHVYDLIVASHRQQIDDLADSVANQGWADE